MKKRLTGIPGLDQMTHGGVAALGGTLILGRPAAGKTVISLQILARALERGEGAIFVSFEESEAQILRDARSFRWGHQLQQGERFAMIDARIGAHSQMAGQFDLEGLKAVIEHSQTHLKASWLVFDGIDQLLQRERDPITAVDEVHRLSDWCEQRELTLLLTGKLDEDRLVPRQLEGIEFLLPCVFILTSGLVNHRLSRRFRIAKYRGTGHATDEVAIIIDGQGIHFPFCDHGQPDPVPASTQRVSTGVSQLDDVLGGGLYRGSTALVSGQPGTAKTTLCGSFAAAAAMRDERVLFVSFDERESAVVRNLATIGIDLATPLSTGHLTFVSRQAWSALIEEHYFDMTRLIDELQPDCLVIDPLSALLKATGADSAQASIERLLANAQARGITTLLTSLGNQEEPTSEATLSHASTLVDTWMVLGYYISAGERNRSLSVVKSRGSAHSNQVREMTLSRGGIALADVYEFGSEVLMGTARVQKQSEERAAERRRALENEQRRRLLTQQLEQAKAEARRLELELSVDDQQSQTSTRRSSEHRQDIHSQRTQAWSSPAATPTSDHRDQPEDAS